MMAITRWQTVLIAAMLLTVSSAGAQNLVQPQIVKIPMKGGGIFGSDVEMVSHLYRPDGEAPFPTVIFSHGRSSADHWNLKNPVSVGHGNFWLRKGFALVAPVRPGYGDTGGVDRENAGGNWRNGRCMGYPDYAKVAKIAGESVLTTLDWVRGQPWARTDKVLLVGQSVGGLTTVAVGAMNPRGVIGYINFSGGDGGSPDDSPGRSCRPETLTDLFQEFGKTTKLPSLWLYAENDLYWGPTAPNDWHRAFSAGGSKTLFVMTPPVPGATDGHRLLTVGGKLWSPYVNAFVKELGY